MHAYPDKVHIIPDTRKMETVGRLADGRFIVQQRQFDPADPKARQFFVSYVFDSDGKLVDDLVSVVEAGTELDVVTEHAKIFGPASPAEFDIAPFSLSREGLTFGFVARQLESADDEEDDADNAPWIVEALPGMTMTFREPFNSATAGD